MWPLEASRLRLSPDSTYWIDAAACSRSPRGPERNNLDERRTTMHAYGMHSHQNWANTMKQQAMHNYTKVKRHIFQTDADGCSGCVRQNVFPTNKCSYRNTRKNTVACVSCPKIHILHTRKGSKWQHMAGYILPGQHNERERKLRWQATLVFMKSSTVVGICWTAVASVAITSLGILFAKAIALAWGKRVVTGRSASAWSDEARHQ